MFVMMVYDVPSDRGGIFLKIGRRYINHEQASVFWGTIPASKFMALQRELMAVVADGDRVTLLHAENRHNVRVTGIVRGGVSGPARMVEDGRHGADSVVL